MNIADLIIRLIENEKKVAMLISSTGRALDEFLNGDHEVTMTFEDFWKEDDECGGDDYS